MVDLGQAFRSDLTFMMFLNKVGWRVGYARWIKVPDEDLVGVDVVRYS
jgi:hypothetical protein